MQTLNARARATRLVAALLFAALGVIATRARADANGVTAIVPPPAPPPAATSIAIAAPPDLAPFLGRPVVRVEVIVDDPVWSDVKPHPITSVRPGEMMSAALARRALSEALESGLFAHGRVAVREDGAGVRLNVHVFVRKIVASLRLDLHGATFERDEILREADLVEDGEILGGEIHAQEERIKSLLARRGFPSAVVSITTRATDDERRVIVLVDVAPGVARTLARRVFYFGDAASERELKTIAQDYAAKSRDRVDEANFEAADAKLQVAVQSQGYYRAAVTHDVVLASGLVTLRVRIDAGPRFIAHFDGNDHYDESTLIAALTLEDDADRSSGHLVQKVKDFYAKRGFLDAEVALENRGDAKTQFLVFHVREHRRVVVGSRQYPCLPVAEIKLLSQGGPRSARAIGKEIDSFLEEELPGADVVTGADVAGTSAVIGGEPVVSSNPEPIDLDPNGTFVADTYDRAILHVQELYRSEGFLYAQVGPVQVVRRRCEERSPPGVCIPMATKVPLPDVCTYDATNLPLPVAPMDHALTCVPDPAHGIECEPRMTLRIPVKLGPRTQLFDVAFSGVHAFSEKRLADAAGLTLGEPVNTLKLDEARRKIRDLYKEEGYVYVDINYTLDSSVDHTRARARFDVIEGEQVIVREIIIRGNDVTNDATIRGRIALQVGQPYRASDEQKTKERIATLNVFSTVNVSLSDPYVPQKSKAVIVTVVEKARQYTELSGGFSTGEGFRGAFEYGQRNLGGSAVSLIFHAQVSYLPDPLIIDSDVRQNWVGVAGDPNHPGLDTSERLAGRVNVGADFPDVGLGPLVRAKIDAVAAHDLYRDFYITKIAGIPSINFRPARQLIISLSTSVEYNYVLLFQFNNIQSYLVSLEQMNGGAPSDLQKLLLLPDGKSGAFAERMLVTWDRRDNSFNARSGTLFVTGIEHVDDWPIGQTNTAAGLDSFHGHFLRLTQTIAGYIGLPAGMRLAMEVRAGLNVQLTKTSQTYPDRLFFLGGPDSMRGWLLSSFIPQDDLDRINDPANRAKVDGDPTKFTSSSQPVRGGNLMFNPRFELRIPVKQPLETVLFTDIGNLWRQASYPFDHMQFPMRASVGTGIRVQTPVGPLVFDYGINVTRKAGEDFGNFHFAIGLF